MIFQKNLKQIAKGLDLPVICTTQVARSEEYSDSERPQLSDLLSGDGLELYL